MLNSFVKCLVYISPEFGGFFGEIFKTNSQFIFLHDHGKFGKCDEFGKNITGMGSKWTSKLCGAKMELFRILLV